MGDLRSAIQGQVQALFGNTDTNRIDLTRPPGDPGLFGPDSAAWRVHGDFTSMMIGGVASLLLQMLHPGALAGVWDHSSFRGDMQGRLRRTAQFISGTTFGSTATAEGLIARVRSIHDRVGGTLADGTPYSANDPALLTWVHVAEIYAFLTAYRRHVDPGFADAEADRYVAETAVVAQRLGAEDVPMTWGQVRAYLQAMRPALRYDHRTREVARALLTQRAPTLALAPFRTLTMTAAADLLPDWAARMHGLAQPMAQRAGVRAGVAGVGTVMRWALKPTR
jgi:uncharacterized protein (DUF2236 family)